MKKLPWFLLCFLLHIAAAFGQSAAPDSLALLINRQEFFLEEKPVEMTIITDFKKMKGEKVKGTYQPAKVMLQIPGGKLITEDIRLYARSKSRREICYMPGIMLNFRNPSSPQLSPLKKMKLVCGCGPTANDEQFLLAEYLVYKLYNQLTEKSFRVRLARLKFQDSQNKLKPYTQFGFLMEDVDDMAERNGCKEVDSPVFLTEQTDRQQMTMVALFEYMIGNTDWSVPNYHNVKLIRPASEPSAKPYVVPYDFDYSGLVNTAYAIPAPELGIEKVTDRLYRGFPRTLDEVQKTLQVFLNKKDSILSIVKNFELIKPRKREEMLGYLDDFYKIISDRRSVEYTFVSNARTQ